MAKILIIYGSSTGNTESIAEALGRSLKDKGHEATVMNAANASPQGVADGYDALLLGCSAWGVSDIDLQDDFKPYAEHFGEMGLKGKKVAAFASGDTSFEHYCACVNVIEALAEKHGVPVIAAGLRVEGDAASAPDDIEEFATAVANGL